MLSLPERHDALEKVRMGDAAILLISPEQLRSPSIRRVLQQREVGLWVLDEANCVLLFAAELRAIDTWNRANGYGPTRIDPGFDPAMKAVFEGLWLNDLLH